MKTKKNYIAPEIDFTEDVAETLCGATSLNNNTKETISDASSVGAKETGSIWSEE